MNGKQSKLGLARLAIMLLLAAAALAVLAGCGLNERSPKALAFNKVKSVTLQCVQICADKEDKPFEAITYTNEAAIRLFVDAVNSARKLGGALDYGAYFQMTVNLDNGGTRLFTLNVDRDSTTDTALLVDMKHSEEGYVVSKKLTTQLSKLIYSTQQEG